MYADTFFIAETEEHDAISDKEYISEHKTGRQLDFIRLVNDGLKLADAKSHRPVANALYRDSNGALVLKHFKTLSLHGI